MRTARVNFRPWDIQEAHAAAECEKCRGNVYPGGARFLWGGRWLCSDCFRAAVRNVLWNDPVQIAQEMGLEVERYD